MVFSRFWYVVLGVVLAGALFLSYVGLGVANHGAERASSQLLNSGAVAVSLYLKDDATRRAAALTPLAVNGDVGEALRKSQGAETSKDVPGGVRDKATAALRKFREQSQDFVAFDALWLVDVHGRVVASDNFEKGAADEGFELGGYPVVADALHGYVRDDSWLFGDDLWRIVARPFEGEVGAAPLGAIVAGKKVDDTLARDVVDHTGTAVVFYAAGQALIKATPASSDTHLVGLTGEDLAKLEKLGPDDGYAEGRSKPALVKRSSGYDVRAVFVRLPGEAWERGAGFAVMHQHAHLESPADFYALATNDEKRAVPLPVLAIVALVAAVIGIALTAFEHGLPLAGFKAGLAVLAQKGNGVDVLKPSTYRGEYKQLAAIVNDALDKVASSAGVERGPADLEKVLGPTSTEPVMSAFAMRAPEPESTKPARVLPKAPPIAAPERRAEPAEETVLSPGNSREQAADEGDGDEATRELDPQAAEALVAEAPPSGARGVSSASGAAVSVATVAAAVAEASSPAAKAAPAEDEETQWRRVYGEFVELKKQLGEPVDKLTYEKFRGTLQRNKDAIVARHGDTGVTFVVYEKQGRAALKASPTK